ncbi:hypothetical protein [Adhaeribacter aerolatus]|nr:hypothetical protein [Adhaeribacter aerolatus]
MNTITNLFNLPDALEWVPCYREVFSVLSPIFTSLGKKLMPLLVAARVS